MTTYSQCSICRHPLWADIVKARGNGRSLRQIEREFPGATRSSLSLHFKGNHDEREGVVLITPTPALPAIPLAADENTIDQVRDLNIKVRGILDAASRAGDPKIALQAVKESRGCIELESKLLGLLGNQNKTTIENNGISPEEYRKTIGIILRALEGFTEARQRVLTALEGMDVIDVPDE